MSIKVLHVVRALMIREVEVPDAIWEAAQAEINGDPYVDGPGQDALNDWMSENGVRVNMEDVSEIEDESYDVVKEGK